LATPLDHILVAGILHDDVTLVKPRPFEVSLQRWYYWKCIAFRDSKLYLRP